MVSIIISIIELETFFLYFKLFNIRNRYKEIISAHGYANNQLTIWKYPSMQKQCELTGHTARVLQMAMSPDGSTVMSAAADETLRLWNCFAPDVHQVKKEKSATKLGPSLFRPNIR